MCWLMLARKLCVYNVGLKVDVSQEILTVVMAPYYENICSCKSLHTVVCHAFYFGDSLCSFLASRLITVILDHEKLTVSSQNQPHNSFYCIFNQAQKCPQNAIIKLLQNFKILYWLTSWKMQHNGTSLCSNLEVHLDAKYLYGMSAPFFQLMWYMWVL